MRHAVLGAGGIGGLLAAAPARTGAEVTLLLRPETPDHSRERRGCWWRCARGGVVGGSVQVGDALFGDDEGESGMHG